MLIIDIKNERLYNEETNSFTTPKPITVRLEHSLISVSKYESIWEVPFLPRNKNDTKTNDQVESYIKCMVIGEVPEYVYKILLLKYADDIVSYIQSPSTATTINKNEPPKTNRQFVTSELIYSWMIALNIPFEAQRWHLNRLLTLIEVCNANNKKPSKANKSSVLRKRRELNRQRLAQINSG